jgi:hypothetical protein
MAYVNQTRPHCVNQMGMTQSKPLAERHGMCELALRLTTYLHLVPDLRMSGAVLQLTEKRTESKSLHNF